MIDARLIFPLVITVDQFTKMKAAELGWMRLNSGISFDIGAALDQTQVFVVVVAALLISSFVLRKSWGDHTLAMALFLAGGTSNILDRVRFGGVQDWIPLPGTGLYNNLADYCIAGSLLYLMVVLLRKKYA